MKTLTAIFVNLMLSIVLACPAFAQNESGNLEGNWLATLDAGGTKLRLVLKIQKTADGYTAKFDSVDQAATDLCRFSESKWKQDEFCRRPVRNEL